MLYVIITQHKTLPPTLFGSINPFWTIVPVEKDVIVPVERWIYNYLCDECRFVSRVIDWNLRFSCFYCSFTALMMLYSEMHLS